jgi:transcription-repair coupling factor (superfamily II helicase)
MTIDTDLPLPTDAVAGPLAPLARLLDDEVATQAVLGRAQVVAVPEAARALFVASLAGVTTRRPILLAVPTGSEAERLVHDLATFLPLDAVELFPAWETLPFERVSPSLETMGRRQRVLWRLRTHALPRERTAAAPVPGAAVSDPMMKVLVAPVRALVQRLGPHVEDVEPVVVRAGDHIDRDDLVARLVTMGYRREYQVEARGEVAVRGSIVDVYPVTDDHPVRIDLWDDEVDRLSAFAVADQRSTHDAAVATVFPARELLPSEEVRARAAELVRSEPWGAEAFERLADGQTFDGMESWLPWLTADEHLLTDLLPDDALALLVEPRRMRDRAQELLEEEAALASTLAVTWGATGRGRSASAWPRLSLSFDRLLAHTKAGATHIVNAPEGPDTPHLAATAFDPVVGDTAGLAQRLRTLAARGARVVLAADGAGSADRLVQVLADDGVDAVRDAIAPGVVGVVVAPLDRGVVVPGAGVALVAEADLTGRRRVHRRARGARRGADLYDALTPGDYVVHQVHGVARYGGMVQRAIGGVARDYLLLEYKGGDKLYVPTEQVQVVRRYTGGETPVLHRMGGADFEKSKARVRAAVREIAQELVVLYRKRLATPGHAFSPDTPWQREIEEAFPFEETPDQAKAIDDVKRDMEQPRPMDRLVCGDVGFGKTEVAVRAAFKAVQDGKQVAVLVPTTLLANQHGQTFRERFASYPVRVEVLSRFLTPKEQDTVVAGVTSGDVDVVIGTHRLLSGDIAFKDLGLLVIDEEQRFGVHHKERIKGLRTGVDALTLSATPIPRTLELSLTGIRDLSLVNTPPEERQPILTYVGEYDDRAVAEPIRRELLREGQVFFVHNQVKDIEFVAEHLRELVPEARIGIAHGQMDEARLERVVLDFWDRAYDVLVCTTIVESGLDIPNVNTLVVDRADRLGLAQLYQLRGRVGRRGQRAYAYLLHPHDARLTEEAYERLKTIGEFTDLGSGFKIAMRDLEIRGAGNLLGGEQSGHIAAVGFDLYCQLVTEAVDELTGTVPEPPVEVTIDLPVDAHLPPEYVTRDDVRMEAYRRLGAVATPDDVDDVRDEWEDRYGPPPPPAEALLAAARLRAECVRLGVSSITVSGGAARVRGLDLPASKQARLERLAPGARFGSGEALVPLKVAPTEVALALTALLRELVPPVASAAP